MATMNVSLPAEMKAFVEAQVATGLYANASDYIRDLIRSRQADVDRLRALIEEGDASGVSPFSPEEVFARAREKYRSRAA
ncbi:type II toxin-antitoxin system ParD family antitoxin [Enterovirga sp. GCM10030262]|uniref:type II toxin-antitoxin system ParD family antitoxin n=1 Tax=Enterovirga sp. GCM10030262 TaxID=3273391 RepID=UPI003607F27E